MHCEKLKQIANLCTLVECLLKLGDARHVNDGKKGFYVLVERNERLSKEINMWKWVLDGNALFQNFI